MSLSPDWSHIRHAFEAALEAEPGERAQVVEDSLADRADLHPEVMRLLHAAGTAASPLDRTATELLEDAFLESGPGGPPEGIQGYAVTEILSSGGMGDVYLARATNSPDGERVAIKVLKRGLDTGAFLRRFELEQRTLSALRHENIVAFHAAGTCADGRPYLVMEFVDGTPITAHCRSRVTDVEERLTLFGAVCRAVSFAHQHLVLHRDLKPANVLVTESGTVKLLDFGVAKLLEPDAEGTATHAAAPITLRYASPEQLRHEPVTVATDVYGLGLLLNELLTGLPPARPGVDTLPSEAVGTADPRALSGLPATPSALRHRYAGDLDAIVRRALSPRPAERYASVDLLGDDVRRHLRGEPITARHLRWTEWTARVARRHRVAAGAMSVLVLLAVGLFIGTWMGKRRAESEASRGWGAHAQALQAARFLEEQLLAARTGQAAPDELEARIERELAHGPEAEALVRLALGRIAMESGHGIEARRHLERAVALAEQRGLNSRDRARALQFLGRTLLDLGEPELARARLRSSVEAYEALHYRDAAGYAEAHRLLSRIPDRAH